MICAACSLGPAASRAKLRRGQLATERARVTGIFGTESGGHFERAPEGVSPSAVLDEAVLVSATPPEVCVELLLRASHDAPIESYEMTLSIDGEPAAPPAITSQRQVTYDYRPTGERAAVVDPAACDRRCQDERGLLRVVERSGRLCGPVARPPREVTLRLIHPTLSFRSPYSGRHRYQLLLAWKLED